MTMRERKRGQRAAREALVVEDDVPCCAVLSVILMERLPR